MEINYMKDIIKGKFDCKGIEYDGNGKKNMKEILNKVN